MSPFLGDILVLPFQTYFMVSECSDKSSHFCNAVYGIITYIHYIIFSENPLYYLRKIC